MNEDIFRELKQLLRRENEISVVDDDLSVFIGGGISMKTYHFIKKVADSILKKVSLTFKFEIEDTTKKELELKWSLREIIDELHLVDIEKISE